MRTIGLFGGTFDPVHFAHLRVGFEIMQTLALDQLRFIPCADPPHKSMTQASSEQRSQMLKIATTGLEAVAIDEREFDRDGPSYTIDTLRSYREEFGDAVSLAWIVGSDSFQSLNTWHQWEALFDYAHILIACRPGWERDHESAMGKQLRHRFIDDPAKIQQKKAGYILPVPVSQLAISATGIRQLIASGKSPRFLVPDGVLKFIDDNELYRQ